MTNISDERLAVLIERCNYSVFRNINLSSWAEFQEALIELRTRRAAEAKDAKGWDCVRMLWNAPACDLSSEDLGKIREAAREHGISLYD
jgi:hypothetical protein